MSLWGAAEQPLQLDVRAACDTVQEGRGKKTNQLYSTETKDQDWMKTHEANTVQNNTDSGFTAMPAARLFRYSSALNKTTDVDLMVTLEKNCHFTVMAIHPKPVEIFQFLDQSGGLAETGRPIQRPD